MKASGERPRPKQKESNDVINTVQTKVDTLVI